MTEQELTALKQQIKDELLAEMSVKPSPRAASLWDDVKKIVLNRTDYLSTYDQHKVLNGISSILRCASGKHQVRLIPYSKENQIKELVSQILDGMDRLRKEVS